MTEKIITIGLTPCWDFTVTGKNLDWGRHKIIDSADSRPAGKALNINRALAWMQCKSIASGLWGKTDYDSMNKEMSSLKKFIGLKLIPAQGLTRTNVTILDTAVKKEMHLRSVSSLATKASLKKLNTALKKIVTRNSICVFAGSMPDKSLAGETGQLIKTCAETGAQVIVDTSGPALKKLTESGYVSMVTPNVEELRDLLRSNIPDTPTALAKAGRVLFRNVNAALISRGKNGALLVTMDGIWAGKAVLKGRKIISTVGCGDYLLAGYLYGIRKSKNYSRALDFALKSATARAMGITETTTFENTARQIKTQIRRSKVSQYR
jgi:1-phosphofructokinase family hexose kinase